MLFHSILRQWGGALTGWSEADPTAGACYDSQLLCVFSVSVQNQVLLIPELVGVRQQESACFLLGFFTLELVSVSFSFVLP